VVEPRCPKIVAQSGLEALVFSEDDSRDHCASLSLDSGREANCDEGAKGVGETADAASMADHPEVARLEHDMYALPAQV
jgi:hypothetical protein